MIRRRPGVDLDEEQPSRGKSKCKGPAAGERQRPEEQEERGCGMAGLS